MKKRSMSILLASAMLASSLAVGAATVQAEEEKRTNMLSVCHSVIWESRGVLP